MDALKILALHYWRTADITIFTQVTSTCEHMGLGKHQEAIVSLFVDIGGICDSRRRFVGSVLSKHNFPITCMGGSTEFLGKWWYEFQGGRYHPKLDASKHGIYAGCICQFQVR
jgi:hypothetical protein